VFHVPVLEVEIILLVVVVIKIGDPNKQGQVEQQKHSVAVTD
jgi:hypothetical protein